MGPIFERLKRGLDDRVSFVRYTVPASQDGGAIIEDLLRKGYLTADRQTNEETGAWTESVELGCFAGTGRICVFDGETLEYVADIGANYSYEEALVAIHAMLEDPGQRSATQGDEEPDRRLKPFER